MNFNSAINTDAPPLAGIKVIEFAGMGTAALAGMMLADFGADVVRIDRHEGQGQLASDADLLGRGKRSIGLDIMTPEGRKTLKSLVAVADVLLVPFRPEFLAKLGLAPDHLAELNPRLICAFTTGFGISGDEFAKRATGHDINFLAISGILSACRHQGQAPVNPGSAVASFVGSSIMGLVGILMALFERVQSGRGQIIDAAAVDGIAYASTFLYRAAESGLWKNRLEQVGTNMLDGGSHFYGTYACKDGKYMSVGAVEPKYYKRLLRGLGLDAKRDKLPHQMDQSKWPFMKTRFEEIFLTKTRDEWASILGELNACAHPVLDFKEARAHQLNQDRGVFVPSKGKSDVFEPRASPILMRTPAVAPRTSPKPGQDTEEILRDFGILQDGGDLAHKPSDLNKDAIANLLLKTATAKL